MTAEPDLLPLPNHPRGTECWPPQMSAYARANVARATAARDAEVEALRAEVERQKQWLAFWENFALHQPTQAEQAEARAERLAEALRMMVEMVEMDGFGKGAAMDTTRAALAQQPAAVDGAVLHEYIEARDAYEAATRPPNSHAPAPRLKHGDPIVLRYQKARAALAAQPRGSDNDH